MSIVARTSVVGWLKFTVGSCGAGRVRSVPRERSPPMRKHVLRGSAVVAITAATAISGMAIGSATSGAGPTLSDVATPNSRSDGYAPASKLAAELRTTAVAQGSTGVENPSPTTSAYGYNN